MPDSSSAQPSDRRMLSAGWEFCATPPGAFTHPSAVTTSWLPAFAPSTAASALRAAGLWSFDTAARRFDAEDWWYRLRFAHEAAAHGDTVLGFDGLATVAEVWLNGTQILESDNMFLRHECSVQKLIAADNELYIRFRSLDALLKLKRPRPRWRAPMIENQHLRWYRTTLLGRTPGWSPPAAAVGPWQPVWLEQRREPRLQDVKLRARVMDSRGVAELHCKMTGVNPAARLELVVSGNGVSVAADLTLGEAGDYSSRVEISEPKLWWPHTHGDPALYDAAVLISLPDAKPVTLSLGQLGFRTVVLDTSDDGFSLRVNGVAVFCRGACWTPLDVVALRSDPEKYAEALQQVRLAGMNMLRVGGTMVYEDTAFYAGCDRLGLLVWQDFMFANMDYPQDDPAFATSVGKEARQVLSRLHAHPSLALLCGNSEVEQQAAMSGAPREHWQPALFHDVLARISSQLCPDLPYWPSSAHGGAFPHQPSAGSTSYYGVGAYLRPAEDARRVELRFASECLAFANVPDDATLRLVPGGATVRVHHPAWKMRSPRDLGAGWDFDDVRDHYLQQLFDINPLALRYSDHARYLALSRLVSGECMAGAFSEWRRARSSCDGALVWFLRDLWPGAGWGLIDADGLPKAAYHYLRRALQPISLHIADEGLNGLVIHATNETATNLSGSLNLQLLRNGEVPIAQHTRPVEVSARAGLEVQVDALLEGFSDLAYAYRFGPPAFDVAIATLTIEHGPHVQRDPSEAWYFPRGSALSAQTEPGLQARASIAATGIVELTLNTRAVARSLFIDVPGYLPEDQYFHLRPGVDRVIRLTPGTDATAAPRGSVWPINSRHPSQIKFSS